VRNDARTEYCPALVNVLFQYTYYALHSYGPCYVLLQAEALNAFH